MHDLRGNDKPRGKIGHAGRKGLRATAGSPRGGVAVRWCVYLLLCGDGSLYAGSTNDLPARLARHRRGSGARYTRGRGPLALAFCEPAADRGAALRRERELKRLRRAEKLALCGTLR